jgi:hypothetical protein
MAPSLPAAADARTSSAVRQASFRGDSSKTVAAAASDGLQDLQPPLVASVGPHDDLLHRSRAAPAKPSDVIQFANAYAWRDDTRSRGHAVCRCSRELRGRRPHPNGSRVLLDTRRKPSLQFRDSDQTWTGRRQLPCCNAALAIAPTAKLHMIEDPGSSGCVRLALGSVPGTTSQDRPASRSVKVLYRKACSAKRFHAHPQPQ